MKASRIHRQAWAAGLVALLLAAPMLLSLHGCTDLGEDVFGAVTADNFYRTEAEVIAALAPVYAQLRSTLGDYHNLSQVSTDETIVPTRGSDWFDGGIWLQTHRHTWDPSLGFLNGAWVNAYTGIARANTVLDNLEEVDVPGKDAIVAELRALRGFYYYLLMDLFGGIPIVTAPAVDPDSPPARNTRAEVFAFIETELNEARQALPAEWDAANYGRMTQGACDAMLANMYLNAEVFTGEVTASGLTKGTARWQDAIDRADMIIDSGVYELAEDWFSIFAPNNSNHPEHIFVVAHLPEDGLGLDFVMRTLHYNQFTPSPWNGFATLAETYNAFDENDQRRNIFLAGQAYNVETGEPVNNRQGEPLIFTPEIQDITNATEGEGVRIFKFPDDPNHEAQHNGNDYPFFRLSETYLIKAEALNELGQTAEAIDLINLLRERVFEPDEPLDPGAFDQAALRDHIGQERLFELFYEAKRRQDLIRHGKFNEAWTFKEESAPHRILFPVPQVQLDANPNLTQNAGY